MDNNQEIIVWGSGDQRRSYVHAQDCAKVMIELAKIKFCDGPLNIGTNETIYIKCLVHLICEASNNYPNIISIMLVTRVWKKVCQKKTLKFYYLANQMQKKKKEYFL